MGNLRFGSGLLPWGEGGRRRRPGEGSSPPEGPHEPGVILSPFATLRVNSAKNLLLARWQGFILPPRPGEVGRHDERAASWWAFVFVAAGFRPARSVVAPFGARTGDIAAHRAALQRVAPLSSPPAQPGVRGAIRRDGGRFIRAARGIRRQGFFLPSLPGEAWGEGATLWYFRDEGLVILRSPGRFCHSERQRARLFDSDCCRCHFVQTLGQLRRQQDFRLFGWVLRPEHSHLLIWPSERADPSQIVQSLKERTAKSALAHLRQNAAHPGCARMLERLVLPETVHRPSTHRLWQRRFYPFGIFSEKKRLEKLNDMQANPVKRGLVASPDLWPWSSFRFYHLGDTSLLRMDRMP